MKFRAAFFNGSDWWYVSIPSINWMCNDCNKRGASFYSMASLDKSFNSIRLHIDYKNKHKKDFFFHDKCIMSHIRSEISKDYLLIKTGVFNEKKLKELIFSLKLLI